MIRKSVSFDTQSNNIFLLCQDAVSLLAEIAVVVIVVVAGTVAVAEPVIVMSLWC